MTLSFVLNVPPPALLLPHVTFDQRNEKVTATGIGQLSAGALWGWVKCEFHPVEISGGLDRDEFGVDPDYRVEHGISIISMDQRAADDERFQLERRRDLMMFELMDLYWNDYYDYRESMRD